MSNLKPTYPVGTIAKLLLISERRVQQLTKDGIIPKADRGRYELAPVVQGYIRFLQDRNLKADNNLVIDVNSEKARKIKAEADIAELEAAKKKGETANIKDVRVAVEKAFAEVRTNMRNIPSRLATQLIGEQNETSIKQKILMEVDLALNALADEITVDEEEPEGE
jgi:phage terminase Nu1 subunit (DNA packaging protein)